MSSNAFISYSHADEKALERLHKHMAMLQRDGSLTTWTDHAILPGEKVGGEIDKHLQASAIFIALVSPDYIASNYCYEKEFQQAQALFEAGKLRIVPVILEPCDWLNTPFREFLALPKDGQPISNWTNQNTAFLDVVNGLRRVLEVPMLGTLSNTDNTGIHTSSMGRRPRVKQDFDTIQKSDFADKAYKVIQNYFRASCDEINNIGDTLKAKFEAMSATAFTCTVVNRTKISGGEAHITVTNSKQRGYRGDISYSYERHAMGNSSNGSFNVAADDYNLFLTAGPMAMMGQNEETKLSPEQAAEDLWNKFVKQAGIEYE